MRATDLDVMGKAAVDDDPDDEYPRVPSLITAVERGEWVCQGRSLLVMGMCK